MNVGFVLVDLVGFAGFGGGLFGEGAMDTAIPGTGASTPGGGEALIPGLDRPNSQGGGDEAIPNPFF